METTQCRKFALITVTQRGGGSVEDSRFLSVTRAGQVPPSSFRTVNAFFTMRTFEILLMLLLCITFCSGLSNRQDNGLQQIDSKEGNSRPPYAMASRRQTRSIGSFVNNEIEQLMWTFIRIPTMIIELFADVISDFINAIWDVIKLFLYPVRRIMNGFVRTKRENPPCLLERLLSDLWQIMFHPFEFMEDSIKATGNFARNQTMRLLQDALNRGWRFVSTTGLPLLRRTLDRVASMPTTPDNVRTLIKNFDSMYNIFQMFGYVSPAY